MDSSKKPEKANPRARVSIFSQLFFAWTVPVLLKASRFGLSTDDLTLCLEKDKSEKLGDKLEQSWERECQRAAQEHRKPNLKKAIIRLYFSLCIIDGILIFLFVLIKSLLPVVLAQFLLQFQRPPTTEFLVGSDFNVQEFNRTRRAIAQNATDNLVDPPSEATFDGSVPMSTQPQWTSAVWNDVYCLAAGIVSFTFLACLISHHADLRLRMLGARLRIACCALIYRKTIRISKKAAGQTSTGYLVNLLSNDVSRLDFVFQFMHYVWILPFQSVLISYLIWRQVGWASLVGVVGLLIKTIPVQTGLSRLSSYVRVRVAKRTDHRVGIMNELIQGIKLIKTYAWEIPFQAIVAEARRREVKFIRYASYIRGILLSTMVFIERSTLFITSAACVYLGYPITADVVFSMAQFFNILQLTAAIFYPLALSLWAESNVSVSRIGDYLQFEEQDEVIPGLKHKEDAKDVELTIEFNQLSATWEDEKNKTLNGITFSVKPGQLCAIIGPVGSGKSSLLQLLLGEMPIHTGTATINGSLSYASQEPWLFTGTVRHNILFGQEYDRRRYQDVVRHCALLTDFEQLPNGDQTMVGERGAALSGGQKARISLARCVYRKASIYLLDDPLSAVDSHVGRHLFDEVIGPSGCLAHNKSTRLLVTHQVHYLKSADWIIIIENGEISRQGTYTDLSNSNLDFAKLLQKEEKTPEKQLRSSLESLREETEDEEDIPFIDGYVGVTKRSSSQSSQQSKLNSNDFEDNEREEKEDQAEGSVPFSVFKRYFFAGSNCCGLLILLFVLILSQVIISGSDYFVNFWTQQEFLRGLDQETMFTTEECLLIYGLFILAVIFMTTIRGWMFFNLCMRASKQLHNKMFASILHAPMVFFDANPSGRILNRFSRDMGSIDELLPKAMMDSIQIGLVMIGILSMVTIVNPILLGALTIAICLFWLVLKLYIPASQDLKRLEGICRSPIFSYVSASLSGLSTIRAARIQNRISSEFDCLQDVHSAIWQVTYSTNTALGLWLDCISTAFVAAVTFSFLALHETFSGNVGLAVSQALILTGMVQFGIRQTTESLQQMTSVERILHYTDLPAEKSPAVQAPEKWPSAGIVEFRRMSLLYNQVEGAVLKNLNLTIEAGWKVGIVGRTGAGKSSLISALFRLYDIEGVIRIDGIDTASISLEQLRSSISIIPQDPVLFSATIRYNLDPFHLFTDAEIYRVLEEVELKHVAEDLDYMVLEGGVNFSVGQRQLICLARAILRNNKILVLDEATANVDPQTDALIQKTIREKFRHCTVLTVAHRLITVMDSDRIIVMEAGEAKEFDVPHLLLQNETGLLLDMVNATGPRESKTLKRIAAETYNSHN